MNIIEFQEKLKDIKQLFKAQNNIIDMSQIREFFSGDDLTEEQQDQVAEYFVNQGMIVMGRDKAGKEGIQAREIVPLTYEEEAYLTMYQKELKNSGIFCSGQELLERTVAGDKAAKEQLVTYYMPKVIEIARHYNHEDIFIGDIIAEGNLYLVMASNILDSRGDSDSIILRTVEAGIVKFVEEQTNQKQQDEMMVDKVIRLEAAIKDLTGEDDKMEFSVDELAIFLDMSREELADILRLAGEAE